jgi:hypothetical protein
MPQSGKPASGCTEGFGGQEPWPRLYFGAFDQRRQQTSKSSGSSLFDCFVTKRVTKQRTNELRPKSNRCDALTTTDETTKRTR